MASVSAWVPTPAFMADRRICSKSSKPAPRFFAVSPISVNFCCSWSRYWCSSRPTLTTNRPAMASRTCWTVALMSSLVLVACLPNSSSFLMPWSMPWANSAKSATSLTRTSPITAMSSSPPLPPQPVDLAHAVVWLWLALTQHEEVAGLGRHGVGRAHQVDHDRADHAEVNVGQPVGQRGLQFEAPPIHELAPRHGGFKFAHGLVQCQSQPVQEQAVWRQWGGPAAASVSWPLLGGVGASGSVRRSPLTKPALAASRASVARCLNGSAKISSTVANTGWLVSV